MFNSKKQQLFEVKGKKTSDTKSSFIGAGMKKSAETLSGNLAKKYETTGNDFVDQFGIMGSFREPRDFQSISVDMSKLWAVDPLTTVKLTLYVRMISRTTMYLDGTKTGTVQRGSGLRHEGIMRMIWISIFYPDTFWENINLFIAVGSWKDIIQMLSYDLQYNGWNERQLEWNKLGQVILGGLENPNTSELIKKYLPQIKAKSKCTTLESQADTIIGKWICSLLFGDNEKGKNYKQYRKLKSSGTAHEWQKLISQGRFLEIDFDSVHGRALSQLVSSKFLENQKLTYKYEKWIMSKPIAKFTGFPHELFQKFLPKLHRENLKRYEIETLNKQFYGLVETAKKDADTDISMIVVRDTSGSMSWSGAGTGMANGDIAKSLGLFFGYMLPDGYFAKTWIEFSRDAKMHQWKGSNPYENWISDNANYVGNTNFQSVIDLFCRIKINDRVLESEFPTGILCISDGEFDPGALNSTNVEIAKRKLNDAGFSDEYVGNFKIVLWNLQSRFYGPDTGKKFETYGDQQNVYYFSGYDPSIVAFLTGVKGQEKEPKSAEELFNAAMDQEVLNNCSL